MKSRISSIALSLAASLLAVVVSCGPGEVRNGCSSGYVNPAGDEIPVMAWFTMYGPHLDASHFKDLSDAGFNLAFSFISSIGELDSVLAGAEGTGVKVIASCNEMKKDPQGTVTHLKGNPAVAAYFIKDEPFAKDLDSLSFWFDSIREVDDSKLLYCNLNPSYCPGELLGFDTYEEYVATYCDRINPKFLSFDHYPVHTEGLRPDFWYNLEVVSAEARRRSIPFWGFALSTGHAIYPVATFESMSLQIWSNLAYGAQGIEYFTFLSSLDGKFHDGPIDSDGNRTPVYEAVARLNSHVQSLKDVFLGDEVLGVWHTGSELPQGTKPLETLPSGFESFESGDKGFLVSHLKNGRNEYLMVVNHDWQEAQSFSVELSRPVRQLLYTGETIKWRKGINECLLNPGDMVLLRIK